jgi:hypothetical protein
MKGLAETLMQGEVVVGFHSLFDSVISLQQVISPSTTQINRNFPYHHYVMYTYHGDIT